MKTSRSSGPEDLHPLIIIQLLSYLKKALAYLNRTLVTGDIPEEGQIGNISYKKRAENYWPISLTSTVCKLREKFIKQAVKDYLIDDGSVVDTIYLDFSKAVDTIPHPRLMSKLRNYWESSRMDLFFYHLSFFIIYHFSYQFYLEEGLVGGG